MNYKLQIQNEAIIDVEIAYQWYEDKRMDLGLELIEEIENCCTSICDHPDQYGFVRNSEHYRRIRVSRFPYMIVYEVENHTVIINAVSHIRQNRSFI